MDKPSLTARSHYLRALSDYLSASVAKPEDLEFLPDNIEGDPFTQQEMQVAGMHLTNITGVYAIGQTSTAEILLSRWKELGYIPETSTRPLRPGEVQGRFIRSVSVKEFEALRSQGKLLFPRRRGRPGSPREKLTAFAIDDIRRLCIECRRPCLINMNVLTLARLDEVLGLPIPSIIVTASPEAHRLYQTLRGLTPSDSQGIGSYGLSLPDDARVYGIVWIENQPAPWVEDLSEAVRRRSVIRLGVKRLQTPLTELEQRYVLPSEHGLTRAQLLRRTLFRGERCAHDAAVWSWVQTLSDENRRDML